MKLLTFCLVLGVLLYHGVNLFLSEEYRVGFRRTKLTLKFAGAEVFNVPTWLSTLSHQMAMDGASLKIVAASQFLASSLGEKFSPSPASLPLGHLTSSSKPLYLEARSKIGDEFFALMTQYTRFLAAKNIDVLLLPIPDEGTVTPTRLKHGAFGLIYQDLLRIDPDRAIDLVESFREASIRTPGNILYDKSDDHWTAYGADLAVREIVLALKKHGTRPKRLIVFGTSFSAKHFPTGSSLPESLSNVLQVELHDFSFSGSGIVGSLQKMHDQHFELGPGDLVIWEFAVVEIFLPKRINEAEEMLRRALPR